MYQFNKFGVCLNPEVVCDFRDGHNEIKITLAESNGGWGFGKDVQFNQGSYFEGCGFGCSLTREGRFPYISRQAALVNAIHMVKLYIERRREKYGLQTKIIKQFYQWVEQEKTPQLSLF